MRTALAPCANPTCRQPVALDGSPQVPAGLLCLAHLKLATGADLSRIADLASCEFAAHTCGQPATVRGLASWYCTKHSPRILRPPRDIQAEKAKKAKSKAHIERMRKAPKLTIDDIEA